MPDPFSTPIRPLELRNSNVELHPESDTQMRPTYELSMLHVVRWVQCPRCWSRFWYVLSSETPQPELWYHGMTLRQKLVNESCDAHRAAGARPSP
jgi:hypothetical protein